MNRWQARSYLAPNMLSFYRAAADRIGQQLGIAIDLAQAEYDALEDDGLVTGRVDIAFLCGLPWVRINRRNPQELIAIAAPIPDDPRNQGQPVYFTDFITHVNSVSQTMDDLAGKTFAFNDPGSNSGYHLPRYVLWQHGYPSAFFGSTIATGSHQHSIRWVAEGKADCAAIDSTVLAQFRRDHPALADQIRVVASSDPCPIPPLAITATHLDSIRAIQDALITPDEKLREAMIRHGMNGFAAVSPDDYAVVGEMFDTVEAAGYTLS